ncbi:hypothetical protein, partial [Chthonomonas calidirosea]|uniref:hypothetical protein n=1 Tax=Chthonomonas calidirosea TaxID=454171 RepID=UPI0006ECBC94
FRQIVGDMGRHGIPNGQAQGPAPTIGVWWFCRGDPLWSPDDIPYGRPISANCGSSRQASGRPGAEVEVTLEIEVRLPNRADEQTVRVVSENCRTLKFTNHGFETD